MWRNIGKALAWVGKQSLRGAVWASQHPEVIAGVAAATGHPGVAVAVNQVGAAVKGAKEE